MDTWKRILGAAVTLVFVIGGVCSFIMDSGCSCTGHVSPNTAGFKSISFHFDSSNKNVNPGRGYCWVRHISTKDNSYVPLKDVTALPDDQNVVQILYVLDRYINSDHLDCDFMNKIQADMDYVRRNGWTTILRFAYTTHYYKSNPDTDAGITRIVNHIRDLKPVFVRNEGIIAAVQAGFVGSYGEWHYGSLDFGKPYNCSSTFGFSRTQINNMKRVITEMLAAVPESIDIQVRTPFFKYLYLNDETPTTEHDLVHRNSKSRIGFYNDTFLADNTTNQGTFKCLSKDKQYMQDDSLYTVVAGETDNDTFTDWFNCGVARTELKKYHYSILNNRRMKGVLDNWKENGCYNEFAARLGYRLSRFRGVLTNVDVRLWLPETTNTLSGTVGVPTYLQGRFKVYLVLVDKVLGLTEEKYFVLMSNTGVPDTSSRMNSLLHEIEIKPGTCSGGSVHNPLHHWASGLSTGSGQSTACGTSTGSTDTGSGGTATGSNTGSPCSYSLVDGSFETDSGWVNYGGGFSKHSSAGANKGTYYITITDGGARQVLTFDQSVVHRFTLSGYSRPHSSVSVSDTSDYSIYCDINHPDGKSTYGQKEAFDAHGTPHEWQKRELSVSMSKPISSAYCYAMFRNGQGRVDFDNFVLESCS